MEIDVKDAQYLRSILQGIENKYVTEVLGDGRGDWAEQKKKFEEIDSNVDWQYEYKR